MIGATRATSVSEILHVWLYEGLALLMVWLYQLSGAFARDGAVSENRLTPQDRSPDSTFELTAYIRAQLVTLKQMCHFESICLIEIDQAQIRIGAYRQDALTFQIEPPRRRFRNHARDY